MQYTAPLATVNVCVSEDGERVARVYANCPSWADAETHSQIIDIVVKMMDMHARTHAGDCGPHGGAIDKAVIYGAEHISCVLWFDKDGQRIAD